MYKPAIDAREINPSDMADWHRSNMIGNGSIFNTALLVIVTAKAVVI